MPVICRKIASQCVWEPDDDDVAGHALETTRTATITISWSEETDGPRHVELRSDDPEAEHVLIGLLERAARVATEGQGASA
jgi:hypothetical protein